MTHLPFFTDPEHQPFAAGPADGPGVLLLHGFMGTPAELRYLGDTLASHGFRVSVPLLPGFGPEIHNLSTTTRHHWHTAAADHYHSLATYNPQRIIVGYSLGAALAISLATQLYHDGHPPDGIVLIAPFWRMPGWTHYAFQLTLPFKGAFRPFQRANFADPRLRDMFNKMSPELDLADPEVQSRLRKDIQIPLSLLGDIVHVGRAAFRSAVRWPRPTIVIQGHADPLVQPKYTRRLLRRLPPTTPYYELQGGHDIVQPATPQRDQTARAVLGFLRQLGAAPQPAFATGRAPTPR